MGEVRGQGEDQGRVGGSSATDSGNKRDAAVLQDEKWDDAKAAMELTRTAGGANLVQGNCL